MRIAASSFVTLLLLLSLTIPVNTAAIISVSENTSEDASPDSIPIPGENHSVVPIQHVVCDPSDCSIAEVFDENSIELVTSWWEQSHDVFIWSGSFNTSEDHDAVLLEPLSNNSAPPMTIEPSDRDLVYRICIGMTDVPMKLEAWQRDATTLKQLDEVTANTPLMLDEVEYTLEANNSLCMGFIYPASAGVELWLEASSLSTAGNYTFVFSAIELGEIGMNALEHYDVVNSYANAGNSLDGNHTVLFHPTDSSKVWDLRSVANSNHSLRIECINSDYTKFECARYQSSLNNIGLHSIGHPDIPGEILHVAPDGVIGFEFVLELNEPAMWAIEHNLEASYGDPVMEYFEVEPYVDDMSMTRFPTGDAPGNLSDMQCDVDAVHYLGCRYFPANEGFSRSGHLPLAIFDEADVWALDIESSTQVKSFILEVQIQAEPGSVMLELHTVDWNGSITITSLTPMSGEAETLRIEVIPDVHYLRVINIRMGDVQNWSYGDLDQPVTEYWLRVDWIANTSAVEDDFTPSAELLFWDNLLLWAWGICFLLPLMWVLLNIRKDKMRMQILLHDRARLARLRHLTNPEEAAEARKDLTMFISALTKLDWSVLLSTWGEPDISHLTPDAQLHMWRLDQALAVHSTGVPLLVMVEVAKADWEISALRFEAPEGSAWNVASVLPNLLSRGHEIFLDDLRVGSRIFVNVELVGEADRIALHLSGIQKGAPVAAKPAHSLILDAHESE